MTWNLFKIRGFSETSWFSLEWSCDSIMKSCNHLGFKIACHSLFLALISKSLIPLLLLMSQDVLILCISKTQVKEEMIWQVSCHNIILLLFLKICAQMPFNLDVLPKANQSMDYTCTQFDKAMNLLSLLLVV